MSLTRVTGRRLFYFTLGAFALAVGAFLFEWPSSIKHRSAGSPAVSSASDESVPLSSSASSRTELEPTPPDPAVLSGVVRDAGSGLALQSVEVAIYGLGDSGNRGPRLGSVRSDATGRFEFRVADLSSLGGLRVDTKLMAYHKTIQFLDGVPEKPLEVLLRKVSFVPKVGRVVDVHGAGIPGVQVRMDADSTNIYELGDVEAAGASVEVVTGADGTFVIDRFPADQPFSIEFDGGDFLTRTRLELVHAKDNLLVPPITLLPACTWTIQTLNSEGLPYPGLWLTMQPSEALRDTLATLEAAGRPVSYHGFSSHGMLRMVDAAGHLQLRQVPLGEYQLEARWLQAIAATMSVSLSSAEETTVFQINARPDLTIVLRDEAGRPLHDFECVQHGNWKQDVAPRIYNELGASCFAVGLEAALEIQSATGQLQHIVLKRETVTDGRVEVQVDAFPAVVTLRLGRTEVAFESVTDRGASIEMRLDSDAVYRFLREECGIVKFRVRVNNGKIPRTLYAVLHRLYRDEQDRYRSVSWFPYPGHVSPKQVTLLANTGPALLMVKTPENGHTSVFLEIAPMAMVDLGEIRLDQGEPLRLHIAGPKGWAGFAEISMTRLPAEEPAMLSLGGIRVGTHVKVGVPPGVFDHARLAKGRYRLLVEAEGCERWEQIIDLGIGGPRVRQIELRTLGGSPR